MGETTTDLLVSMKNWLLLLLLMVNPASATVDAAHYQQFWLWAAVKPQRVLSSAKTVYVLQGEIAGENGSVVFRPQGVSPVGLRVPELWLAYRVRRLNWPKKISLSISNQIQAWTAKGVRPAGIQIDFDAHTPRLSEYADFLRNLRSQLPTNFRLSITGLLDWTQTGDSAVINGLAGTVDEIVVQTYQGRKTIPNCSAYFASLEKLNVPFKIGLVQDGEWQTEWEDRFGRLPNYRGAVVFLLNPTFAPLPKRQINRGLPK